MLSTSSKSPVLCAELWLEKDTNGNSVQTEKLMFDVKIGQNVAREFGRLKEVLFFDVFFKIICFDYLF